MLLGREAERTRLDALLDAARKGNSGALVIRGEPGIGKSALLRYAVDRGSVLGLTVLTARGLESESEIPFAGLGDLTRPIRKAIDRIPEAQQSALVGALALGPAVPVDRFAICAATFSLLAAAAEDRPLLAVVDDIQWLDSSSVEALLFAVRRLGVEGVAILLAMREGEGHGVQVEELPVLRLQGLDEASSVRLLGQAQYRIAGSVAVQLYRAVHGNPLALMEVPPLLSEAERSGLEPLPEPLPAGARLEQAFLRRLHMLPEVSQRALLVSAASESGDMATIQRALTQLSIPAEALGPAESAGLIAIDGVALRFRHPLIRSTVYQAADPVARRNAHHALAEALNAEEVADRRAWHLAAAATGPDERIASALELAASRSTARSGYVSAGRALARSASLSPLAADRARRLMGAANAYQLSGHAAEALALLDEAGALQPEDRIRSAIEQLRAEIEAWTGHPWAAHERMMREAARYEEREPLTAAAMLAMAAVPCVMGAQIAKALETSRRARALCDRVGGPEPLLVIGLLAESLMLAGRALEAVPLLEDSLQRLGDEGTTFVRESQYIYLTLSGLERYEEARRILSAALSAARGASALGVLPFGLGMLSEIEFKSGNLTAAYANASESARLAEETGQGSSRSFSVVTLARVEAVLGRDDDCRKHLALATALAREYDVGSIFHYVSSALGLLELGRGRPTEAIAPLEECGRLARTNGLREPNIIQWRPDYVESLARVGRLEEAWKTLADFDEEAERTGRVWALATAARCRGYLSDDEFERHFERALEFHGRVPSPFEIARTRLCYGEVLRRHRRRVEAREHLAAALETFESIGAEPWADRARTELSATGEKARKRDVASNLTLTPQELQIALAVADGATNREAAAQLFLSPKTVEAHLSSAYRKLGVRSRTELVVRIASSTARPAVAPALRAGV